MGKATRRELHTDPPHNKTRALFEDPRIEGNKSLDWCLADRWYCELPAATTYCRLEGYNYADDRERNANVESTVIIGTGGMCGTHPCVGFHYIDDVVSLDFHTFIFL